jgi:hypothetical protein
MRPALRVRPARWARLSAGVAAALCWSSAALAKGQDAVVLPAVTPVSECVACPALHRPSPEAERQLASLARELDGIVVDAAQDLGLSVDLSRRPTTMSATPSERALVEQATQSWVFSPRLALDAGRVVVRIVVARPGSPVLLVRTEEMRPEELEVRAVLMMRDLVHASGAAAPASAPTPEADPHAVVHAARSPGRAVLALNTAVLGGYIGFALQRAGGSNDARLTYPLIALGTGLGLGASMLVAEEWDVGVGDAWYLAAGMWWPAIGALLIGGDAPASSRFLYGAGAAAGGMALATTALTFGGMTEGDAVVAHSGGAFGTVLGGVADLIVQGRTDVTPTRGMGIGAISGVVLTGAVARVAPAQPASRVLLIDLIAGLGGLTGAAVASPLVFGENVSATRNRLWLSSIAVGTFVGAGLGLLTTPAPHEPRRTHAAGSATTVSPFVGVVAQTVNPDGTSVPVAGLGARGLW